MLNFYFSVLQVSLHSGELHEEKERESVGG